MVNHFIKQQLEKLQEIEFKTYIHINKFKLGIAKLFYYFYAKLSYDKHI